MEPTAICVTSIIERSQLRPGESVVITGPGPIGLISLAIAIELSIVNNFVWNDLWTFGEGHRSRNVWHRFISFQLVSIGGALINWFLYYLLTRFGGVEYLLANLMAILVAFSWNYLVNRNITWRRG
jgi:dolichol-phosphate mannosyltransferase